MVTELRETADPEIIQKKVAKYTQSFDLLDKLGADNCVDPEDFDQEDLEDDLFKNLQITDLEEIFNQSDVQSQRDSSNNDQSINDQSREPARDLNETPRDAQMRKYLDEDSDSENDQLLLDKDSDMMKLDDDDF